MWNAIYDRFEQQGRMPNRFSEGIGKLIREAREQAGMSQADLAKKVYKRRPSLSDIENGKMYPDIETMYYLCLVLKKPLTYFVPEKYRRQIDIDKLSISESELLLVFRRLEDDKQRIALKQLFALIDDENLE